MESVPRVPDEKFDGVFFKHPSPRKMQQRKRERDSFPRFWARRLLIHSEIFSLPKSATSFDARVPPQSLTTALRGYRITVLRGGQSKQGLRYTEKPIYSPTLTNNFRPYLRCSPRNSSTHTYCAALTRAAKWHALWPHSNNNNNNNSNNNNNNNDTRKQRA